MYIYSENIYTPAGFQKGYIKIENGKIAEICEEIMDEPFVDYNEKVIIPGFIDIHIHGWGTGSFWLEGTEASLANMAKDLVSEGVTSFLGTTGTASVQQIKNQVSEGKRFIDRWTPQDGAEPLGFHLEGPFINKEYKGMQKEEYCINPDLNILLEFLEAAGKDNVKLMTLAPELEGSREVIEYCKYNGIQLSIGHSAASFDEIKELKDLGLGGITHMYSGMKGFHHRELGVVGAGLYFDDLYVEFAKQTGLTVKKEAFEIAYRVKGKEKIILTTDCVGLAHVREPFYHYIRKCTYTPLEDKVKLVHDDGREELVDKYSYEDVKDMELSFLGSVRNIAKNIGASISDIVVMASENPAKYIGVDDHKGSIALGKDADLLVIDENWNLYDVYVKGELQDIR